MPDNKANQISCFGVTLKHDISKNIYSSNDFAKMLFKILCKEHDLEYSKLALFTNRGAFLCAFPETVSEYDSEYKSILKQFQSSYTFNSKKQNVDFVILSYDKECDQNKILKLQESFTALMSVIAYKFNTQDFFLKSLDALPKSICIYDNNGNIVFANEDFCKYANIKNREAIYGRHVNEVLKEIGTQFISMDKAQKHMKIFDVLKQGSTVLDWDVEVISNSNNKINQYASNDMYPFFDDIGNIKGAIEIARSRNKQIKEARNVIGFKADYTFDDIIGDSQVIKKTKELAMTFAHAPYNVFIYGESGVGKELFAQSIHNHSNRKKGPFVALNCASISPELIDSELFGYESGAFTGASKNGQAGKFELADDGTLFLDEVAELPLHFQTKLLRALETKQITRIGGSKSIPVNVRIICATNQSLEDMVAQKFFREDLYYRLMVLNITIPPLREHINDLPQYADYFLEKAAYQNGTNKKKLDNEAIDLMIKYNWPGNIRELRNIINRASVYTNTPVIGKEIIARFLNSKISKPTYTDTSPDSPEFSIQKRKDKINQAYAELIEEAYSLANFNKTKAAEIMGVSRRTFYNLLEKYSSYFTIL